MQSCSNPKPSKFLVKKKSCSGLKMLFEIFQLHPKQVGTLNYTSWFESIKTLFPEGFQSKTMKTIFLSITKNRNVFFIHLLDFEKVHTRKFIHNRNFLSQHKDYQLTIFYSNLITENVSSIINIELFLFCLLSDGILFYKILVLLSFIVM